MLSSRNRLLTEGAISMFVFVLLLTTHISLTCAGSTAHTVTPDGNTQIDTAQNKFGGASALFDGTGDGLSTPDSSDWAFGTGDFTIDFWSRLSTIATSIPLYQQSQNTNNEIFFFYKQSTGRLTFYAYIAGSYQIRFYCSWSPATNTWYHIALVRSGNTWYIFIDGASQSLALESGSWSGSVSDISASLIIGGTGLSGWLDEYRVSKGAARWTSSFTPPTAAYATDSPTVLLLHMDGTDGSTTFTDDSVSVGPDFQISASPTAQSVGAGSAASYTLSLSASGGYSGTVSLTVTSGLPSDATGTITPSSVNSFPATATLSVSTAITTPSGTSSIVVTATDGTITHTVTVSLEVSGPASYAFNVKASATQVVVTLTYSWSGSGSPPQGSITIAGPGGTPTLSEAGAVAYDRTSITVSGGTSSYSIMHRAIFTISAPGSDQNWTALISLSGVINYNVAIEVS